MFGMVGKYSDNPASKSQSAHSALLMIGTLTSCKTVGAGSYFPELINYSPFGIIFLKKLFSGIVPSKILFPLPWKKKE